MVNSVFIFIISDKRKGVYLSRMLKVAKYMETLEKSGATVNGSTYEKSIRIHANNTKLSLTQLEKKTRQTFKGMKIIKEIQIVYTDKKHKKKIKTIKKF